LQLDKWQLGPLRVVNLIAFACVIYWSRKLLTRLFLIEPFIQFADGSFIGDYTQVATGTAGLAYGSWTDFRGNPGITPANQDVMIQSFVP
jgi:hypothetical protein